MTHTGTPADESSSSDPVEVLWRWERSGAVWRVLGRSGTDLTVGLFTCDGGEEMGRLTDDSPELRDFVGNRTSNLD